MEDPGASQKASLYSDDHRHFPYWCSNSGPVSECHSPERVDGAAQ